MGGGGGGGGVLETRKKALSCALSVFWGIFASFHGYSEVMKLGFI